MWPLMNIRKTRKRYSWGIHSGFDLVCSQTLVEANSRTCVPQLLLPHYNPFLKPVTLALAVSVPRSCVLLRSMLLISHYELLPEGHGFFTRHRRVVFHASTGCRGEVVVIFTLLSCFFLILRMSRATLMDQIPTIRHEPTAFVLSSFGNHGFIGLSVGIA